MKSIHDLLLLGNPLLYEKSEFVLLTEREKIHAWVQDLDQVMQDIRAKYKFGRGIAAPQLGIMKRLIYIRIDTPLIIINPEIIETSKELFEVWDDCMCFPQLLVKVKRHKSIRFSYLDEQWVQHIVHWSDAMAELFQHEYDHLEGILCTMRALDNQSFKWRSI